MGFFSKIFGFLEGSDYAATRRALQDIATFSREPPTAARAYWKERCRFRVPESSSGGGGSSFLDVSAGSFSMPSVEELRSQVRHEVDSWLLLLTKEGNERDDDDGGDDRNVPPRWERSTIRVRNMVGEARSLHSEPFAGIRGCRRQREEEEDSFLPPDNYYVFQAASQFNLLEFPSPRVTPEAGIGGYVHDRTQGPACAIACGAGTAYRNYLVPVDDDDGGRGPRGQTRDRQLNGMGPLEEHLEAHHSADLPGGRAPWRVENGYVESDRRDLAALNALLGSDPKLRSELISKVRIGVQEDTAVTDVLPDERLVTQTYNSAISIGYSKVRPGDLWVPIAKIVLQASYEATLLVAMLKSVELAGRDGRPPTTVTVLLTKVGGGVFGNDDSWIVEAMDRAIREVDSLVTGPLGMGLDVRIVHFGSIQQEYRSLERR